MDDIMHVSQGGGSFRCQAILVATQVAVSLVHVLWTMFNSCFPR